MVDSQKCPECGSSKLKLNADGLVCMKCGLLISETLFSGEEELH
jgi:transcription initiation factor TFIIIB Brf1 subunit/transcription initiation factor TFIIB